MKNIIVTGTSEVEVVGVLSLLDGMGVAATRLGDAPPTSNDLVIVVMSAVPLLGWGKQFLRLLDMKLQWQCELVVLVPNAVAPIRLLDGIGCILPGGYSLDWTSKALMSLITKWRQGKALPRGNVRRLLRAGAIDIDEVKRFFALVFPVVEPFRISKTVYGQRNRAVAFMGLSHLQHAKLFMAGVSSREMQNAVVASMTPSVAPKTNVSIILRRYSFGLNGKQCQDFRVIRPQ